MDPLAWLKWLSRFTPGPVSIGGPTIDPIPQVPRRQEGFDPTPEFTRLLEKIDQLPVHVSTVDPQQEIAALHEGYDEDRWMEELLKEPMAARDVVSQPGGKHPVGWITGPDIVDYIGEMTGSPEAAEDAELAQALGGLTNVLLNLEERISPVRAWESVLQALPGLADFTPPTLGTSGRYMPHKQLGGTIYLDPARAEKLLRERWGGTVPEGIPPAAPGLAQHELGHAVHWAASGPLRPGPGGGIELPELGSLGNEAFVTAATRAVQDPRLMQRIQDAATSGRGLTFAVRDGGVYRLGPDGVDALAQLAGILGERGYAAETVPLELPGWVYALGADPLASASLREARDFLRLALRRRAGPSR